MRHRRRSDGGRIQQVTRAVPRIRGADGSFERFRQSEIEHLHRAVGPHLDVRGLEIAMDDALLVRGFECLGDLSGDRQGVVHRDGAAGEPLRQVFALDQFHHERRQTRVLWIRRRGLLEPVNLRDVRMVE